LPVTSDISSIPQYVKDGKTGFVWQRKTDEWEMIFTEALKLEESAFNKMKKEIEQILPLFTYEYFAKRIKKEVFEID
jgi:glycosyltransferase involved in cell wall biosynthesis